MRTHAQEGTPAIGAPAGAADPRRTRARRTPAPRVRTAVHPSADAGRLPAERRARPAQGTAFDRRTRAIASAVGGPHLAGDDLGRLPLPAPAGAPRPRLHHAEQPRPHGLACTPASRTAAKRFGDLAAYFAERARGGVGLIVTGGFAPNIEGWAKPSPARCPRPPRPAGTARSPTPCTPRAARSRCRSCTPAATPTSRSRWRPRGSRAPSRPSRPASPHAARRRAADPRLRPLRRAGARSRVRRRRDHGLRGLLHQPVPGHPHQPADRRVGRLVREPHAPAGGDRAAHARGRRARTSSSSTGCRCWTSSPTAARGRRPSSWPRPSTAAGATIINTGIGWHEARVPTIATSVPRAAFTWVTEKMRDELRVRGHRHPAGHHQPHQHARGGRAGARGGRRRHGQHGATAAGRPRLRPQGRGGPRRPDQHLHRVQPGLPRPRLQEPLDLLPGQPARGPRARARDRSDAGPASASRSWAPDRPDWPRPRRSPSAAMRWTCSTAPTGSAASSTWPCASRARRSSARRCATSRIGSRTPGYGSTCRRASAPRTSQGWAWTRSCWPPASPRATRTSPARTGRTC